MEAREERIPGGVRKALGGTWEFAGPWSPTMAPDVDASEEAGRRETRQAERRAGTGCASQAPRGEMGTEDRGQLPQAARGDRAQARGGEGARPPRPRPHSAC